MAVATKLSGTVSVTIIIIVGCSFTSLFIQPTQITQHNGKDAIELPVTEASHTHVRAIEDLGTFCHIVVAAAEEEGVESNAITASSYLLFLTRCDMSTAPLTVPITSCLKALDYAFSETLFSVSSEYRPRLYPINGNLPNTNPSCGQSDKSSPATCGMLSCPQLLHGPHHQNTTFVGGEEYAHSYYTTICLSSK